MSDVQRSILSGFLSILGVRAVTIVMGVATTPILYRILGPRAVGIFGTVVAVQALFMIFVSAGVTDGVRKFVAEDRDADNWQADVVGFYFRLAFGLAAVGATIMAAATHFGLVAAAFGPEYTPYFYVLVLGVFAAQFWGYTRRTLLGFGLERYSEPLKLFNHGLFVGLALPLALWYGALGALVGRVLSGLVAAIVGLGVVVARTDVSPGAAVQTPPDSFPRRRLLAFNSLTIVLMFLVMSLYHVDVVMLQLFIGGAPVGTYKGALTMAEFLWMVPATVQMTFVHSTSELWADDRVEKVNDLAARTTRYTLLLTLLLGVGLVSLADAVVPLYLGQAYEAAVLPLVLLVPGAIGFSLARPVLAIEQGKGDLARPIAATAGAAVLNLVLNLLLIPRYGIAGAAVATSAGYGSMFVFHLWSARRLGFDPTADLRLARVAVTAVGAGVPILLLPGVIPGAVAVPGLGVDVPYSLFVVPPVGLLLFTATALAAGALDLDEAADLLASFPDPVGALGERLGRRAEG